MGKSTETELFEQLLAEMKSMKDGNGFESIEGGVDGIVDGLKGISGRLDKLIEKDKEMEKILQDIIDRQEQHKKVMNRYK